MASLRMPIIIPLEWANIYVVGYTAFNTADMIVEYNLVYVGPDYQEAAEAHKDIIQCAINGLFILYEYWNNGNRVSRTCYSFPNLELEYHDHDLQGVPVRTQGSLPQDEP